MKQAEKYYSNNLYDLTTKEKEEVIALIKQAQIDAYNEAINDAVDTMKNQATLNLPISVILKLKK